MAAFAFFIEDDRYTVPTLEFVLAPDAARARQLASERLIASPHHLSVLVHQDGQQMFQVVRPGRRNAADREQPRA